jgi:hypothetical protein
MAARNPGGQPVGTERSMSVSGGPTNPCIVLADGASIAAQQLATYTLSCRGFRNALVHAVGDQTWDYYLEGRLESMAAVGQLYDAAGTKLQKTSIAAAAGVIVPVEIAGLVEFAVGLFNNHASDAMTHTLIVTLVP